MSSLLMAMCVRAQTPSAPASGAPALDVILKDLGSTDFSTREKAQKQLQVVPPEQHQMLWDRMDASDDPEVKARLRQRIVEMDEILADSGKPLPISIDVRDANLKEVAAALSHATGAPVEVARTWTAGGRFTLKMRDVPFWEVIRALSRQHSLRLVDGSGCTLDESAPSGLEDLKVVGPFALYCESITRTSSMELQGETRGAKPAEFTMSWVCSPDPRVLVIEADTPIQTLSGEGKAPRLSSPNATYPGNIKRTVLQKTGTLALTGDPGPAPLTASGKLAVTISARTMVKTIEKPETQLGTLFTLPGWEIQVKDVKRREDVIDSIEIEFKRNAAGTNGMRNDLSVELTDAAGKSTKMRYVSIVPGRAGAAVPTQTPKITALKAPLTLALSTPATQKLSLPFEFTDLRIPYLPQDIRP